MRRVLPICMVLMLIFPIVTANIEYPEKINIINEQSNNEKFRNVYIEIEGHLENQWKIMFLKPFGDYRSTVLYWHMELKNNAQVSIFTEENGEILYSHQGEIKYNIFSFIGTYIPSRPDENEPLNIEISGHVSLISLKEKSSSINDYKFNQNNFQTGNKESFRNCYIELSGRIHNDWPAIIKLPNMVQFGWIKSTEEDVLFGLYSYILFENDASINIYSEKNGELLFQHSKDKDPLITIIGYNGLYKYINPENELSQVTLNGNVRSVSIRLKNYGT